MCAATHCLLCEGLCFYTCIALLVCDLVDSCDLIACLEATVKTIRSFLKPGTLALKAWHCEESLKCKTYSWEHLGAIATFRLSVPNRGESHGDAKIVACLYLIDQLPGMHAFVGTSALSSQEDPSRVKQNQNGCKMESLWQGHAMFKLTYIDCNRIQSKSQDWTKAWRSLVLQIALLGSPTANGERT